MSLKIKNLTFSFDKACLFNNLDFEVEKNEIVYVTGQSGVGKSTLLNIISGLIKPDSGSIKNNEVLFNDTKYFPSFIISKFVIISFSILYLIFILLSA